MMSRRHIFSFVLLLSCLYGQAQQLVLTREGLRSSADENLPYVEYAYRSFNQQQMRDFCAERLAGMDFFKYEIKNVDDNTISLCGFMDGSCFLIFGKKEISFCLEIELGESSAKVKADLSKTNGRPLSYGLLFSKKDKVRYAPTKNRIEDEIKSLIQQIFDNKVIIQ